jgi:hypothetical protein
MQSEQEQKAFNLGAEAYKKAVLEMLYNQLDLQEDPDSSCEACKVTKQYIGAIENKTDLNDTGK